MAPAALQSLLSRQGFHRWRGRVKNDTTTNLVALATGASTVASLVAVVVGMEQQEQPKQHEQAGISLLIKHQQHNEQRQSFLDRFLLFRSIIQSTNVLTTCRCDDNLHEFDQEHPDGYTEAERYFQSLEYHRSLLYDYIRRWEDEEANQKVQAAELQWPRHVPTAPQIPGLELDWLFCEASPHYRDNKRTCQNLQFRIAAYYLMKNGDSDKMKGYKLVKDLADHGHPDGMCLYAIMLMDGHVPGIDANPEEAVVWFRRCVSLHRHIAATYELAIAYYTGEGGVENPEAAVKLFRQAANLGHAGAAYMLGECLLDGAGCLRDRANALEWLVTAAELGHNLGRERVLSVLQQEHETLDEYSSSQEARMEEALKWASRRKDEAGKLERRHTVGSHNPQIIARRKTKVQESRGG